MSGSLPPFLTLARDVVADCRVFKVERVRRRSGRSGQEHDFYNLAAGDWVNIVPITREGELVLVRQERHGIGAFTLEVPGGMVDAGEDPATAALRELREETGFAGTRALPLGWVHPNPAIQSNRCHSFLATDVVHEGELKLDGREEIEVVTVPVARAHELVRDGLITHALVVCALYLYEMQRRPM